MSDGASEAPMWMPRWDGMPAGARRVLVWLILWRDGRGSCDPTNEELAYVTGLDVATIRRHTGWLEREGWAQRERRRRPDNSLGGWRYWLDLEKLGLAGSDRAFCAVPPGVDSSAEATAEPTAQNVEVPPGATAQPTAQNAPSADKAPRKMRGVIEPGERARARLSLYSFPPSFAFRDDDQREKMEAILAVCGRGLCDPEQCEGLTESLADVLDDWLTRFDLDADIKPCIRSQTAGRRPKPVYDFKLFDRPGDSDLQRFHDARVEREQRKAAKAEKAATPKASKGFASPAPAHDPEAQRVKRMAALRREIAIIDRGERPPFLLSAREQRLSGESLEDAFQALRRRNAEELAGLENAAPNTVEG